MKRSTAAILLVILSMTFWAAIVLFDGFQASATIPTKSESVCGSESFQLIVNGGVHKVSKDVSICK